MPYSVDLKIRVLQFVEQGGGISKAAKLYLVGRATIYRWLGQTNLEPIKVKRRQRKLDWEALRQDVQDNPDARLIDRANKFGVKVSSIWYALKQMQITRKKTPEVQRTPT